MFRGDRPSLLFAISFCLACGCTGELNDDDVIITCPQTAGEDGMVTVTDPEGNSDSLSFTITPCIDESVNG